MIGSVLREKSYPIQGLGDGMTLLATNMEWMEINAPNKIISSIIKCLNQVTVLVSGYQLRVPQKLS